MTTTEQAVRTAKNPQEAMLAIAKALDRIEAEVAEHGGRVDDGWGDWGTEPLVYVPHPDEVEELRTQITGTPDDPEVTVEIPPASEAKQDYRRKFEAQFLHLGEHLQGDEDWGEAYAKGGPRWLYYGNRDLFISYPRQIIAQMIEDVIEESPQEAHEIGRDALKFSGETGPGGTGMHVDESFAPIR